MSTTVISLLGSPSYDHDLVPRLMCEPHRKYILEQEFLFLLLKVRISLLIYDIASWFQVSNGNVSEIFTTWAKLLSKYLVIKEKSQCSFA